MSLRFKDLLLSDGSLLRLALARPLFDLNWMIFFETSYGNSPSVYEALGTDMNFANVAASTVCAGTMGRFVRDRIFGCGNYAVMYIAYFEFYYSAYFYV